MRWLQLLTVKRKQKKLIDETKKIKRKKEKLKSGKPKINGWVKDVRKDSPTKKEKTIARKRAYDGEISEEVKRELEKLGLTREIESQIKAKEKTKAFVLK